MHFASLSAALALLGSSALASPAPAGAKDVAPVRRTPGPDANVQFVQWDDIPWTNKTDGTFEKRTPGGIFICTDINWSGTCGYKVQPISNENLAPEAWTCIQLTSPWYHSISSIGPDPGARVDSYQDFCCGFCPDDGPCTSGNGCPQLEVEYPGYSDLRAEGWNDLIGSFYVFSD